MQRNFNVPHVRPYEWHSGGGARGGGSGTAGAGESSRGFAGTAGGDDAGRSDTGASTAHVTNTTGTNGGGVDTADRMDIDTGAENVIGVAHDERGDSHMTSIAPLAGQVMANGDLRGGDTTVRDAEEIPESDVAVLSNHISEVGAVINWS